MLSGSCLVGFSVCVRCMGAPSLDVAARFFRTPEMDAVVGMQAHGEIG